jgi:hypothetical protein
MARNPGDDAFHWQEAIRRRATELYQRTGALPGHDLDNWCAAEAEIMRESAGYHTRLAIVVNVGGVVYTGEYESAFAEGYVPGEWKPGDPVPVRFSGDKLYLRRGNGRELKTIIVKRIG